MDTFENSVILELMIISNGERNVANSIRSLLHFETNDSVKIYLLKGGHMTRAKMLKTLQQS